MTQCQTNFIQEAITLNEFQRVPEVETVNDINHHRIAWDKINQAGKNEYSTVTETSLQSVHIPCEALSCKDVECTNVTHRNDISKFYNDIVQVLCEGGDVVSNNTYCRNGTTNTARNNCRPEKNAQAWQTRPISHTQTPGLPHQYGQTPI